MMVAALYVQSNGCYANLPDVDPWDEARDARKYDGPHPVVAHPPCERWGRYWYGGPSARVRRQRGDDGGCFAAALESVRKWGGVLEHPESSSAWPAFGLLAPLLGGGWSVAGDGIGWTCCVEQGHYGHRARKTTWLYAVGVALPSLRWGRSAATLSSTTKRTGAVAMMARRERSATPLPFRDLLLAMARSVAANARAA